ncbi:stage II sporulation protein M [Georgenia sp. TF02-10]|uniref:stage II sporulation protein M n=1 Tax=Georgenia sp. TF02-10 TaxID=2917725 RepID=UPI001FA718D8|nr:stage II sporulation protein M [Georgenia sp. TF02-10]UNX55806.1 stage II sporulation protein M [Georgenia sp. TF02-10]
MDADAFAAVHGPEWERLATLTRQRRLTGAEVDELVRLYQTTAGHLSAVRTAAPDPHLVGRLSTLVGQARGRVAGSHELRLTDVGRFFTAHLPAAFYRVRWWTVGVMVAWVGLAVVVGAYTAATPAALAGLGSPAELTEYAEEAFAAYYSNYPAPDFAAQVWTNNAWIAAQCIGLGITGVFPLYVLFTNAVGVGGAGAIMATYGSLPVFFGLILPHGLMELTAIFIAGGTGLKLCWTALVPGRRTRSRALAEEGRSLVIVAVGLVLVLAVSGLVEGFVTPSALPTAAKIAIGAAVLAGYWTYTLVLGRRAVVAGETGDLREDVAGHVLAQAG